MPLRTGVMLARVVLYLYVVLMGVAFLLEQPAGARDRHRALTACNSLA